jgi:hypothetical protein
MTGVRVGHLRRGALASVAPVVLAALFYLLFRDDRTWLVSGALHSPLGGLLHTIRASSIPLGPRLPSLVMDVAPDFLWALALGALLSSLHLRRRGRRVWFVIGLGSAIGYEIAQRFHLVPGTFDVRDLAAQAIGFIVGWYALAASTPESRRRTLVAFVP